MIIHVLTVVLYVPFGLTCLFIRAVIVSCCVNVTKVNKTEV